MATMEKLEIAYNEVFDAQGNIRACGREACIALIEECKKVESYIYFGDVKTGHMQIEAIKQLVQSEI